MQLDDFPDLADLHQEPRIANLAAMSKFPLALRKSRKNLTSPFAH